MDGNLWYNKESKREFLNKRIFGDGGFVWDRFRGLTREFDPHVLGAARWVKVSLPRPFAMESLFSSLSLLESRLDALEEGAASTARQHQTGIA